VARRLIVTRADVEECYSPASVAAEFVPTHRVHVVDTRSRSRVLRTDFVRLEESRSDNGVAYAYGPTDEEPLYAVLSTGLWQSFAIHGRVKATPVRYDAHYIAPKERDGLVYFVQAGPRGPIKVGWSQDVERRIAELQTANAAKLVLLGTVSGTLETEAALHARFSHLRLEAEWFRNSPEIHEFLRESTVVTLYSPSRE
jgi:hypothetical protein